MSPLGLTRRTFARRGLLGAGALMIAPTTLATTSRAAGSSPTRIDVHAHAIPPTLRLAYDRAGITSVGGIGVPQWTPDLALAFMDRQAIGTQVLSVPDPSLGDIPAPTRTDVARKINGELARVIGDHPTRFGAFAVLPMHDPDAAIAEIRRSLDTLHLDGVALPTNVNGRYLGDPAYLRILTELSKRKATVFLHPASPQPDDKPELDVPGGYLEDTFEPVRAITNLLYSGQLGLAKNIRWILGHGGGALPYLAHRVTVVLKAVGGPSSTILTATKVAPKGSGDALPDLFTNMAYDTALASSSSSVEAIRAIVPTDQVMLGTNWPMTRSGFKRKGGDPAPELSGFLTPADRVTVDRTSALARLPTLAARLAG